MPLTNKRVGISYISDRENLEDLYNEEIVVNKVSGDVYVKTPTLGNVISYNYLTRFNNHIAELSSESLRLGAHCHIVELTIDDPVLPNIIPYNTNILDSPVTIPIGAFSFMISIDMDCLSIESDGFSKELYEHVSIDYEFIEKVTGTTIEHVSGSLPFSELKTYIFDTSEMIDSIQMISLKIQCPQEYRSSIRCIVNSICTLIHHNGLSVVSNIFVEHQHTNSQYASRAFDPAGMVITGYDYFNNRINITNPTYTITHDGDIVPNNIFTETGTHVITITYGDLSTSYTFNVIERIVEYLIIVSPTNKLSYAVGESIDTTGLVVHAVYNTGDVEPITSSDYTITGFDSSSYTPSQTITISYRGQSVTYTIEILRDLYLYSIENDEATLYMYLGHDTIVTVPSTIASYPVKCIESSCFTYAGLLEVTIPDSIERIY